MLQRAWHHLGPIAGLLALFIALGGPAWAADKIDGRSIKASTVSSKQIKNSSLKGADVKDGSLTGADLQDGSIGTVDLAGSLVAPSARSLPGLRTQTNATSPNILGGASGNTVGAGAVGSVIGGGGAASFLNAVTDSFGTVAGGRDNTAGDGAGTTTDALGASVGGGEGNAAGGLFSTVPGGFDNSATGDFSLAAGRRARAVHDGSFVWADSGNSDFSSTADDQFAIRAGNGVHIASDAGPGVGVPVGTRFRDNGIVAWGRVTAAGSLDTNFNVVTLTHVGTGHYRIDLGSSLQSGFTLVPAVTPEVDGVGDVPQPGAANVRFAVTNQFLAGDQFDVFIYNGSFALVDNDFHFLVTGR